MIIFNIVFGLWLFIFSHEPGFYLTFGCVIHKHHTGDEIVNAKIEKVFVDEEGNTKEILCLVGYTPF